MRCRACGSKKAKHKWDVEVCAMRGKKIRGALCTSCDLIWNGLVLAFFNHPKREKLMKDYL